MTTTKRPYRDLQDLIDDFLDSNAEERNVLFEQGDKLRKGCSEEGLKEINRARRRAGLDPVDEQDVLRAVGRASKRGRTTMYGRLLVSRMFPADLVIPDLFPNGVRAVPKDIHWSHYEVCARQWSEDTPNAPYEWLNVAVVEGLSVRRLKAKIKAANGGNPFQTQALYVLDQTEVTVDAWDARAMTCYFDQPFEPPVNDDGSVIRPGPGMRLVLTAVLEPVPVEYQGENPYAVPTH